MKIIFNVGSSKMIINDATTDDIKFLIRLRPIENPYSRKQDLPIEQGKPISDINFYDDNDVEIMGLNSNANNDQIADKFKLLQAEVDRNWNWYKTESEKTKSLEEKVKSLEAAKGEA